MDIYTPENAILHVTKADFYKRIVVAPVHVVQYDKNLPVVEVQLFKNGYPFTLPETANVVVRWGKKDHTFVVKDVLGCNEDRTSVYFEVDEQMSYFYGLHEPILELTIDGKTAGSSAIPFVVDRNPVQETDIESQSKYLNIDGAGAKEVTYDELVQLVADKKLTPGRTYRITDYVASTTQEYTASTNRPFDILVYAINESTLSEDARADHHYDIVKTLIPIYDDSGSSEEGDTLLSNKPSMENHIPALWLQFVDSEEDTPEDYAINGEEPGKGEVFVAYTYAPHPDTGKTVPVLFKGHQEDDDTVTDPDDGYYEADSKSYPADIFYYNGEQQIGGVTYSTWEKFEDGEVSQTGYNGNYEILNPGQRYTYAQPTGRVIYGTESLITQRTIIGYKEVETVVKSKSMEDHDVTKWKIRYNLNNMLWSSIKDIELDDANIEIEPISIENFGEIRYLNTNIVDDNGMHEWKFDENQELPSDYDRADIPDVVYTFAEPNGLSSVYIKDENNNIIYFGYVGDNNINRKRGKGIILWMRDEYNNEANYDIYGIMISAPNVTQPRIGSNSNQSYDNVIEFNTEMAYAFDSFTRDVSIVFGSDVLLKDYHIIRMRSEHSFNNHITINSKINRYLLENNYIVLSHCEGNVFYSTYIGDMYFRDVMRCYFYGDVVKVTITPIDGLGLHDKTDMFFANSFNKTIAFTIFNIPVNNTVFSECIYGIFFVKKVSSTNDEGLCINSAFRIPLVYGNQLNSLADSLASNSMYDIKRYDMLPTIGNHAEMRSLSFTVRNSEVTPFITSNDSSSNFYIDGSHLIDKLSTLLKKCYKINIDNSIVMLPFYKTRIGTTEGNYGYPGITIKNSKFIIRGCKTSSLYFSALSIINSDINVAFDINSGTFDKPSIGLYCRKTYIHIGGYESNSFFNFVPGKVDNNRVDYEFVRTHIDIGEGDFVIGQSTGGSLSDYTFNDFVVCNIENSNGGIYIIRNSTYNTINNCTIMNIYPSRAPQKIRFIANAKKINKYKFDGWGLNFGKTGNDFTLGDNKIVLSSALQNVEYISDE